MAGRRLQIKTPRWILPLLEPARYKGAHGGRGSGKSHGFGEMLIEEHVVDQNQRSVCVREVQKSLEQSVKRLLEIKIEELGVQEYFDIQQTQIKSRYGDGLIIFQGMQNHTADSIKSLEGYDRAWCEEAQSLSQRSLDMLRPTIRKPGSQLWFTWNPRESKDPIDRLLRSGDRPPGSTVVEVNYADNPWFPDVLREEMEWDKRRDPDKYAHVWLGGYLQRGESRVFHNWRVEEFDTPDDVDRFYLGGDFGFNDPTVLVRCWLDGRTLYIDHEAYRVNCKLDRIAELYDSVPGSRDWPITADSSRPDTIALLRDAGFVVHSSKKGANSVVEGVEFLKSFDIIVHPRCKHTADELATYSYKVDAKTEEVLPVLKDKDNHVIDSLRYAVESLRRATNSRLPSLAPAGERADNWAHL